MKKQLDEMDKTMKQRAQAFGFKFVILLLAVWTLYESYLALKTGQRLNILPCLALTVSSTVAGIYELILKRRMIQGDEEYHEPNKALLLIIGAAAAAAVIVSIGSFIMLHIN